MIKTIPLDITFTFLIGTIFALLSRKELESKESYQTVGFRLAGIYGLWFGLTVTYFYFKYPDWMYCYFLDVSVILIVVGWFMFMSALLVSGLSGYLLSASFIKLKLNKFILPIYSLLMFGLVFLFTSERYFVLGNYKQFQSGQIKKIFEVAGMSTAFKIAALFEILPLIAIFIFLYLKNRKEEQ